MDDKKRTALMLFVKSIFPVLIFTGVWSIGEQEVAAIMLMIGYGLDLFMLFWKSGQEPGPHATAALQARIELLEELLEYSGRKPPHDSHFDSPPAANFSGLGERRSPGGPPA